MYSPSISVIIPVYNAEPFVAEAIQSILGQTFTDFELIIVNDGSTDKSMESIQSFSDKRIRLIDNGCNQGNYPSRNTGYRMAKGKYICVMDADDVSLPCRLEQQFLFMETNPDIAIAGCNYKSFGDNEYDEIRVADHDFLKVSSLVDNLLCHPSLIMRHDFLKTHCLEYNPFFQYAGDYDLVARAVNKGRLANMEQILVHYRRHHNQMSASKQKYSNEVDSIRLQQLQYLGITPSDEEKQLHLDLINRRTLDYGRKVRLLEWIDRLTNANIKRNYYHHGYLAQLFESLLAQQYFISQESSIGGHKFILTPAKKYDLDDVTFVIPVRIESDYRKANLDALLQTLERDFDTSIIILEADKQQFYTLCGDAGSIEYHFIYDDDPVFHRTKYINQLLRLSQTQYVAVWDTDAIAPREQIAGAIAQLRQKQAVMAFPYDGRFYRTDKFMSHLYRKYQIIEWLDKHKESLYLMDGYHSVGGAFLVNRNSYIDAGGENENIYGWGPEDKERVKRMEVLGLPIYRSIGPMFHLWHPRGKNSWFQKTTIEIENRKEFLKTCSYTKVFSAVHKNKILS